MIYTCKNILAKLAIIEKISIIIVLVYNYNNLVTFCNNYSSSLFSQVNFCKNPHKLQLQNFKVLSFKLKANEPKFSIIYT